MMQIRFTTSYSPVKGQRFEAGAVVEVDAEIAADLIQRGVALPVQAQAERAVAPGQTIGGS